MDESDIHNHSTDDVTISTKCNSIYNLEAMGRSQTTRAVIVSDLENDENTPPSNGQKSRDKTIESGKRTIQSVGTEDIRSNITTTIPVPNPNRYTTMSTNNAPNNTSDDVSVVVIFLPVNGELEHINESFGGDLNATRSSKELSFSPDEVISNTPLVQFGMDVHDDDILGDVYMNRGGSSGVRLIFMLCSDKTKRTSFVRRVKKIYNDHPLKVVIVVDEDWCWYCKIINRCVQSCKSAKEKSGMCHMRVHTEGYTTMGEFLNSIVLDEEMKYRGSNTLKAADLWRKKSRLAVPCVDKKRRAPSRKINSARNPKKRKV